MGTVKRANIRVLHLKTYVIHRKVVRIKIGHMINNLCILRYSGAQKYIGLR